MKKNQLGGISPNKQNKYSIRKYTVGTASLLIGSTLIFGVHAKDANAAEEVAKQTLSAEENKEESVNQSKELNDEEIPQVNEQKGDVTEEENVVEDLPEEENVTEEADQPKQEEKTVEKQQSEDKTASEKPDTPTQKSTEKAPSVDENKETQATTSERKATESASDVAPKDVNNSTETQVPVNNEKAASAPQANGLADTVKQVALLTSNQEKEAELVDYYSKNAGVSSETAKQVVQGMNLDYQNLDSDQLTAEMLIALANKQEKNTPKATPVSLRPRSAMMRSTSISGVNEARLTGNDVNNLINSKTTLTVNDSDNSNTIEPGKDSISWKSNVLVDDKVKSGDYFTIKYSDTIQAYGLNPVDIKNIGNIYDPNNGEVIALAEHDTANHQIKYTFTDYVNRFNNVKMNMNYTLYIDPKTIPQSTKGVEFSVTIGEQTTSIESDIMYKGYSVKGDNSIGSAFSDTISNKGNKENPGSYKQTVYVNPLDKNLKNANLTVRAYAPNEPTNIGQINKEVTNIKIYQAPKGYKLNEGYYVNTSDLKDVTEQYKTKTIFSPNETVDIALGNINSPYVVVIDTKFKYTESETPKLIQFAKLSSDGNIFVSTGNGLGFTGSSSGGTGEPVYRVGNYVWEDNNHNGIQELGETGVGKVKVEVYNTVDNKLVGEAITKEDGSYLIPNLPNGKYRVEFSNLPNGYLVSPTYEGDNDKLDSNGLVSEITINGEDNLSADLGIYKPTYSLGDKVWEDTNKNGIQDDGEKGIRDVKVTLTDKDGKVVETKTDESGNYKFEGLTNGDYTVKFETPSGYEPTVKDQGGNDEKDSDGTEVTVKINGKNDLTIDSGFYKPTYSLGDKVWEDTNKNGIQDDGEKGIGDVKVTLTDKDGKVVETKTDESGKYKFEGLTNGDYTVKFETPSGYEPTVKDQGGNDEKDSDGTEVIVKINGKNDLTIDSGFYKPTYSLGDKVWEDTNKNGIQDENEKGIKGVKVTLKDSTGEELDTTVTNDKGEYEFKDLPNGEYQVDFETPSGYEPTLKDVQDDKLDSDGPTNAKGIIKDGDNLTVDQGFYKKEEPPVQKPATYKVGEKVWNDTNKDGIQNLNEPGISGVTVTLKQPDGTLITTKTDKDGNYIFKDLPNGKYEISFETPEGYEATTTKAGDDRRLDSDGKTVTVEVNNADDLTIDSGFYKPVVEPPKTDATYKVGDKVWNDTNKDGIQNANEPGIEGVKVTLTKADGTTVETRTDKDGNYIFTDLPNGKYEISFETPEGYEATTANVGDDALDSDGTKVEVEVNNADDLTIDSGFYKPVVEPPKTDATYKVGDKVWNDTNKDGIQNANEPGIEGVKVTLTKADGTTVETRTDKDGNYIFTDLPNGKYEISFETPEGYEATTANVGDDALDSDGTKVEVEVNNADDLTIDSGFYKPTPEVPEQPGNPEVPAPEVPEQPGNPEVPAPEVPEQPGNPEVPAPEVPEQPGNPEKPAPNMPEQPGQPKVEKAMPSTPQKAESKHKKETLPETGQENAGQTTLLGGLFAALGGAFLLGRRRKDKKEQ
ncbi:SdrD B-like domain-containing protein [Staphylococcus schleiferi]|uniref:SdrD B-like domain-containing protein n=2 Tax=Staphylococcus schleiferi TaxID=1295 RepID=UPI0024818897|nr:SdrD B-like domain-containing protein [Staphylococcus schleiferi]